MRSVTCVSVEIQVFILEKSHIKFYQKIWMFKSIVDSLLTHFFYQRDNIGNIYHSNSDFDKEGFLTISSGLISKAILIP